MSLDAPRIKLLISAHITQRMLLQRQDKDIYSINHSICYIGVQYNISCHFNDIMG